MHVSCRLPFLAGILLLAATADARAETPPDPVAPAVIGRPLDRIQPARPVRQKPVAAKPKSAPVAAAPAHRAGPSTHVVGAAAVRPLPATRLIAPGAYFSSEEQELVRKYYATSPAATTASRWKAGEAMPEKAAITGVPDDLRAAFPRLPPGYQYVQLDGEVVLVAVQSRKVIDGVSRR